ncbi:ion channel [Acinetobacter tianfuensis]|uniref:Two pore domain potassium channel family protein n=1 Tax=Acinetobacter tianfuensis TaxID=2419603 RepID=A0A3A8E704_9GAMM|nr:ion channel [Acinetobacter tianfuensis]RKG30822.1 two pore domain potassium channel family protein [Acinetobacter tianfuensis]
MRAFIDFWHGLRVMPSAWLLMLQLLILVLSAVTNHSQSFRALLWLLGAAVLLIIAKVIRQTPVFTILGLSFVGCAMIFSVLILMGADNPVIQIIAHLFEALAYFCAAFGLLRYMFSDRYLTMDELFAAGAVFTLLAWGFAFLYSVCQLIDPQSFANPAQPDMQSWLDLLFLSFSLQSATGLSDIMPISASARVLAMLQMFCGVMYLALVVSRLIALNYVGHLPEERHKDKPAEQEKAE